MINAIYETPEVKKLIHEIFEINEKLDELHGSLDFISQCIDEYKNERNQTYSYIAETKGEIRYLKSEHRNTDGLQESVNNSYDYINEMKEKINEQYMYKDETLAEIKEAKDERKELQGQLISILVKSGVQEGILIFGSKDNSLFISGETGKWRFRYEKAADKSTLRTIKDL